MIFRVIKHCSGQEGLVVEELDHISILRVINYHQWTLSKGTVLICVYSYVMCKSVFVCVCEYVVCV